MFINYVTRDATFFRFSPASRFTLLFLGPLLAQNFLEYPTPFSRLTVFMNEPYKKPFWGAWTDGAGSAVKKTPFYELKKYHFAFRYADSEVHSGKRNSWQLCSVIKYRGAITRLLLIQYSASTGAVFLSDLVGWAVMNEESTTATLVRHTTCARRDVPLCETTAPCSRDGTRDAHA